MNFQTELLPLIFVERTFFFISSLNGGLIFFFLYKICSCLHKCNIYVMTTTLVLNDIKSIFCGGVSSCMPAALLLITKDPIRLIVLVTYPGGTCIKTC